MKKLLVIILFLFIVPLTLLAKTNSNTTYMIPITIEGKIKENIQMPSLFQDNVKSLKSILDTISKASNDSSVKGIILKIKSPEIGLTKLQEIRNALNDFKKSGKIIYSYCESFSKKDYLLASVANKLYISPQGTIDMSGIALELVFLRNTFNKLGITPNFHQIGDYKSASEMFTKSESSKFQKEMVNFLLDGLFNEFVQLISDGRKIEITKLKNLIDKGFFTAQEAKNAKLVDGILYVDDFQKMIEKESTISNKYAKKAGINNKKLNLFDFFSLLTKNKTENKVYNPSIAVVFMEGPIISGKQEKSLFSSSNAIASDEFNVIFRKIKNDNSIKAVILRINSPGGSALASDILWREIYLLNKVKPVVASLSDVAASGGYYIAVACPTIVANPTTITGSIGVVGGKFNLKGLYEKLGIKKEVYKRGKISDIFTDYRDFTVEENKLIHKQMIETYNTFVSKAAQGRKTSIIKMKKLAQGKVYTGRQALKLGLIDHLGGLDQTIKITRKLVKDAENKLEIRTFPEQKSFMEILKSNLMLNHNLLSEFSDTQSIVKPLVNYLSKIVNIFSTERVAIILPFVINIK
ncbi:MAG: signal peptide peptidase SppA [Spirochaetota bacterium]|nr:signal peptide peptidase SppA [Spirochaetota bacterium]